MTPEIYHIPALLEDSINGLNIKPDGIYADVTFGGEHSAPFLESLATTDIFSDSTETRTH